MNSITINLDAIKPMIYDGDSLPYKLSNAMQSVKQHEGDGGYQGAPRLILAVLIRLGGIGEKVGVSPND